MSLKEKILKKKARVGIIGLGYVGLPEAVALAKVGFQVTGIELNKNKVEKVNRGHSYIADIREGELRDVVRRGKLRATTNPSAIRNLDVICICVPTPFNIYKEPDLSYVRDATQQIAKNFRPQPSRFCEQLIILESTIYPGATREVVLPVLSTGPTRKKEGRKVGRDFYLVFSPERIDPGNKKYYITNTPKVVGGITRKCTELGTLFYNQFISKVIPVSSPEVAEMSKLLENIFRNVNIALVNELMLLCDRMKINIWEVIEAAKTKPFGFMSFKPGPGVGGHCIPVDPVYLSWKAKEYDFHTRFIELAAEINSNMPYYVVSKILKLLQHKAKSVSKSKIVILGAAFKKDISDVRNSPALKVIELLKEEDAKVLYNDPYVPMLKIGKDLLKSTNLTPVLLMSADCVVILTDHSNYDYEWIVKNSRLILDTRNVIKKGKVQRL